MRLHWLALFLLAFPASAIEVGSPTAMDISARLSKDLTLRMQYHLEKVFGIKTTEVFIQVEAGLIPEMKKDLTRALRNQLNSAPSSQRSVDGGVTATKGGYEYLFPGLPEGSGEKVESGTYILPGFSLNAPGGAAQGAAQNSAEAAKEAAAPQSLLSPELLNAAGLEVKRIYARVALDESLPQDAEIKVQALMTELLELNPERGDRLNINRQKMPDPIKERLRDPLFLDGIASWALLSAAIVIGFIIFFFIGIYASNSFSGAVRELARAVALRRNLDVSVDSEVKEFLTNSEGEQEVKPRLKAMPAPAAMNKEPSEFMNIPPDKALNLFYLIGKENSAHVAMVVAQLPPASRAAFLKCLEEEKRNEVLQAFAQPQYVEPEILERVKIELEKRIHGVVGGEMDLVQTLEATPLISKIEMLKSLEDSNPELFKAVRKHVLLFEDLVHFDPVELAHILTRISMNDLSSCLMDRIASEEVKNKIFKSLPTKTAEALKETISLTPNMPEERVWEAQDKVLRIIMSFIKQGTVHNPLEKGLVAGGG